MEISYMNSLLTHVLMAGFMVWIIVEIDKAGIVTKNWSFQYATKSACDKKISVFADDPSTYEYKCVKVPYQRD
jgi:hypothetical protein